MPVMSPRVTCHRYRNPDASHVHYSPSPLSLSLPTRGPKLGACPPIRHPDAYLLPYPSTSTRVGRRCFETRSRTIDRVLLSWDACTCQLGCIGGSWPCVAAIGGVRDIATVLAWLAAGGRPAGMRGRTNGGMRKNGQRRLKDSSVYPEAEGHSVRDDNRISINSYRRCVRYLSVLSTDIPHDIHRQQPLDPGSSHVFPRTDQQPVDAHHEHSPVCMPSEDCAACVVKAVTLSPVIGLAFPRCRSVEADLTPRPGLVGVLGTLGMLGTTFPAINHRPRHWTSAQRQSHTTHSHRRHLLLTYGP